MFAMLTISSDSQGFSRGWATVFGLALWLLAAPASAETEIPALASEPAAGTSAAAEDENGDLPQFVSLRAREANLRRGPGKDFRIEWVYKRQGMPLVLLDRFENWRQVRDSEGTVGWMDRQMLSSKRTVMIVGAQQKLKDKPEASSRTLALAEPGAIAEWERCDGAWCLVDFPGPGEKGWLARKNLWGTDLPEDLSAAKPAPSNNPSN